LVRDVNVSAGSPLTLQFAGQLDENGAVTGVEAPVVELVEMVLGEPLQQGAKVSASVAVRLSLIAR
jgi:hypothetical protein